MINITAGREPIHDFFRSLIPASVPATWRKLMSKLECHTYVTLIVY